MNTCNNCKHIGRVYYSGGVGKPHKLCIKSSERRIEYNKKNKGLDFMDNFRLFFDAHDNQKACEFFEENQ